MARSSPPPKNKDPAHPQTALHRYWRNYGPQNFLVFCDVALFVTRADMRLTDVKGNVVKDIVA